MQPEEESDEPRLKLTRLSPLARTQKLCPRCLNPLNRGSKLGGWLIPQDYYCSKCGYTGTVYLEKATESPPPQEDGVAK